MVYYKDKKWKTAGLILTFSERNSSILLGETNHLSPNPVYKSKTSFSETAEAATGSASNKGL